MKKLALITALILLAFAFSGCMDRSDLAYRGGTSEIDHGMRMIDFIEENTSDVVEDEAPADEESPEETDEEEDRNDVPVALAE